MTPNHALAVRRAADGDAEWFLAHPDRNYRVRLATSAEIKMERDARDMEAIPVGFKVFACVWQMERHSRCTALCLGTLDNNAENASEAKAAALFALAVSSAAPTRH